MNAAVRTKLVAGNWKMHGALEQSTGLVDALKAGLGTGGSASMLLCPPSPYLKHVADRLAGSPIQLSATRIPLPFVRLSRL